MSRLESLETVCAEVALGEVEGGWDGEQRVKSAPNERGAREGGGRAVGRVEPVGTAPAHA